MRVAQAAGRERAVPGVVLEPVVMLRLVAKVDVAVDVERVQGRQIEEPVGERLPVVLAVHNRGNGEGEPGPREYPE
jgi:hypothetical protein